MGIWVAIMVAGMIWLMIVNIILEVIIVSSVFQLSVLLETLSLHVVVWSELLLLSVVGIGYHYECTCYSNQFHCNRNFYILLTPNIFL